MNIIITENYEKSCEKAANIISEVIKAKPNAKLGLATGSTPLPIYNKLAEMNKAGKLNFEKVRTVNLDEYVGLDANHPQSYRRFMDENFFNHININKKNTFVALGTGDAKANAKQLDEKIFEDGAIDVQLLGIGNNGHIGFNEARDFVVAPSHIEDLTTSTIEANARFFDDASQVPTKAITMGMSGIMAATQIVLVATGKGKTDAIKGLLGSDKITTQNPATFIKMHPNATVIIDEELANFAGISK